MNALDRDGKSPMHQMLQSLYNSSNLKKDELWAKQTAFAELFINAGTNVSLGNELQNTVLMTAVNLQNASLVKTLIDAGANVNTVSCDHFTALHKCLETLKSKP